MTDFNPTPKEDRIPGDSDIKDLERRVARIELALDKLCPSGPRYWVRQNHDEISLCGKLLVFDSLADAETLVDLLSSLGIDGLDVHVVMDTE